MQLLAGLLCVGVGVLVVTGILGAVLRSIFGSRKTAKTAVRATVSRTIERREPRADRGPDDARWYGPGETAVVAGLTLPGGCIYVGRRLAPVNRSFSTEPALISPDLKTRVDNVDWPGSSMSYWPSYCDIAPECRGAYLRWLADGRRDPTVGVGYVFLFFYGLERRLLHDASRVAVPPEEHAAILEEVERLLEVYGASRSFRGYATDFLDVARLRGGTGSFSATPPPAGYTKGTWPIAVKVGLGEFASERRPLTAEWALAWARFHPEVRFATVATSCPEEFYTLFRARYAKAFGAGLIVAPNRTKLTLSYKPASASFGGALSIPVRDLPDVTVLSAPVMKIREIVDSCVTDLEPYRRLLARAPDARGTVAAATLLPSELASPTKGSEAAGLADLVHRSMAERDHAILGCAEVLGQWPSALADGKLAKAEAVTLAQFLQKSNYGLEPDVRFSGRVPKPTEKIVLFKLPPGAAAVPTPQFRGATALLHMAALVAQADGVVSESEEVRLIGYLESALHLDAAERARLHAHLRWLLANGSKLSEVKKRLDHIDGEKRHAIGEFLVGIAAADGRLDGKEIEVLTKLYGLLGLDSTQLYGDLHGLGVAGDTGPVTVAKGEKAKGFAIPAAPASQGLVLDAARVQAKMRESAAVAAMLQNIFVDDEPVPPAASMPELPKVSGLDAAHSSLLRELAAQAEWSRAAFDAHAARFGLMPDGALEVVNDRAFDVCGEALFEGDDPITANPHVFKELMA
jgi:uncharacterized tellurite resistance protein B-like protein